MEYRKPTQHRMGRREFKHDYSRPGIYHITMHVADGMGQPLGTVQGTDADSAAVTLTPAGEAIRRELLTAITDHYEMITLDEYIVMPEHLHFILNVRAPIVSKSGRPAHLGQVIAGFKTGCNRAFWAATGQTAPTAKPTGTLSHAAPAPAAPAAPAPAAPAAAPDGAAAVGAASTASGGFAARKPRFSTGRPPLFAPGYCDVQPIEPGQLETQRAYIRNNPRSRWLRSHDRALLQRTLLPVVCHRADEGQRAKQKARCLEEAARGVVLVSPRIAPGEQAIIDEAANRGFATILIVDNGFPEVYHPSTERIAACGERRLLLVTPWQYLYRPKDEAVTVPFCKTMNCVAQALCRKKDDWWKSRAPTGGLAAPASGGFAASTVPEQHEQ